MQCRQCGHMLIDPVPLVELKERDMDSVADAEMFDSPLFKSLYRNLVIGPEMSAVKKILPPDRRRLLDVGCGTGWTTAICQEEGFDVTGLEPSKVRSQMARDKYGLKVFTGHIEELNDPQTFDVVVMRHILEHIERPAQVIGRIRDLLSAGGILVVTIPNINTIGRYVFRESWEWILPWHLHFYHPKTLRLLLESQGFEVVKLYQVPSPIWYPHTFSAWFRDHGMPFLSGRFFTVLWIIPSLVLVAIGLVLGMNDNMTVIARKKR
jgi:SAM-dependent methyltransferase